MGMACQVPKRLFEQEAARIAVSVCGRPYRPEGAANASKWETEVSLVSFESITDGLVVRIALPLAVGLGD